MRAPDASNRSYARSSGTRRVCPVRLSAERPRTESVTRPGRLSTISSLAISPAETVTAREGSSIV